MPDLARSFTYMFEDKAWLSKVLVGAAFVLLSPLVIGALFLGGYMVEVIKRSYNDNEVPLPEWDNFGDMIAKGVVVLIISVVVYIPGFIIHFLPCSQLLVFAYTIFAMLVLPILLARYAVTGDLNAVFAFGEIMDIVRDNIANLAAILIMWIVFSVIAFLGILALGIGMLFTMFYANLGLCFLFGKVYQEAIKKQNASGVGGDPGTVG